MTANSRPMSYMQVDVASKTQIAISIRAARFLGAARETVGESDVVRKISQRNAPDAVCLCVQTLDPNARVKSIEHLDLPQDTNERTNACELVIRS